MTHRRRGCNQKWHLKSEVSWWYFLTEVWQKHGAWCGKCQWKIYWLFSDTAYEVGVSTYCDHMGGLNVMTQEGLESQKCRAPACCYENRPHDQEIPTLIVLTSPVAWTGKRLQLDWTGLDWKKTGPPVQSNAVTGGCSCSCLKSGRSKRPVATGCNWSFRVVQHGCQNVHFSDLLMIFDFLWGNYTSNQFNVRILVVPNDRGNVRSIYLGF